MATNEYPDPPIDEVREARWRISARFDHDLKRLVEHYMELQKGYSDRLIFREQPDTVAAHPEVVGTEIR